jgi:hypothetical protein
LTAEEQGKIVSADLRGFEKLCTLLKAFALKVAFFGAFADATRKACAEAKCQSGDFAASCTVDATRKACAEE